MQHLWMQAAVKNDRRRRRRKTETISRIRCCGGNIHFLWVPAHVGISGNEKVDCLAKGVLIKHRTEMEIKSSGSEAKGIV